MVTYTLMGTAKLADVARRAWLADVLDHIAELPQNRVPEVFRWHWKDEQQQAPAA